MLDSSFVILSSLDIRHSSFRPSASEWRLSFRPKWRYVLLFLALSLLGGCGRKAERPPPNIDSLRQVLEKSADSTLAPQGLAESTLTVSAPREKLAAEAG